MLSVVSTVIIPIAYLDKNGEPTLTVTKYQLFDLLSGSFATNIGVDSLGSLSPASFSATTLSSTSSPSVRGTLN